MQDGISLSRSTQASDVLTSNSDSYPRALIRPNMEASTHFGPLGVRAERITEELVRK